MRFDRIIAPTLLGATLWLGGPAEPAFGDPAAEYETCMALARRAPGEALGRAEAWEAEGGGNPARHCAAIALLHRQDYRAAAIRLDELAAELEARDPPLTVDLLDQAGRAWLLAGEPAWARAALDRAVALRPADAELYVARSYAHAAMESYEAALADLARADTLAPGRAEIPLLQAAAYRYEGRLEEALAAVERALALDGGNPRIRLERGNIRWLLDDREGAREDWRRTTVLAPDSAAATAARNNLGRQ
ncbi:MAG: hypothetical protein V3R98_00425 [Alphaproteobacteria bacterium]